MTPPPRWKPAQATVTSVEPRHGLSRTLETLRILGYNETDTTGLVAIRSPIPGVVLDVNTASGELQRSLDNATPIATIANIKQNLTFAFLYNTVGIPVAAGVLYPLFGWLLSPMLASAAMSLSSVSVIANALRLRKFKL